MRAAIISAVMVAGLAVLIISPCMAMAGRKSKEEETQNHEQKNPST